MSPQHINHHACFHSRRGGQLDQRRSCVTFVEAGFPASTSSVTEPSSQNLHHFVVLPRLISIDRATVYSNNNSTDRLCPTIVNSTIPVGPSSARRWITSNRGFSVLGYPTAGARAHESAAFLNKDVFLWSWRALKLSQSLERNVWL